MSEFLEPIDKEIQLRLFQKMRILGREGNSPNTTVNVDDLSYDKMATRSTFIRMTSGLNEPVVLMGGELVETADEDLNIVRNMTQGYDENVPLEEQDHLLLNNVSLLPFFP